MGGDLQTVGLASPGTRIGGGTDEVQLTVLGERALGLPREPSADKDVPPRPAGRNPAKLASGSAMAEEVPCSVADGVATITLNRPERLNALNGAMYEGLIEAFEQTDRDDSVRAVVVTGAARFLAGADLSGGPRTFDYGQDAAASEAHRDRGGMLVLRIYRSLKPVIAAISGGAWPGRCSPAARSGTAATTTASTGGW